MKIEQITLEEPELKALEVLKKQQVEYQLLRSYKPKIDGYTIFEFNPVTSELKEATFRTSDVYDLKGDNSPKLDIDPRCIYVEALNKNNAIKHLKRGTNIL